MTNEGNGAIMRELGISKQAYDFVRSAENSIKPVFERIDANAEVNLARVLAGFRKENVGLRHFAPTTGYGYDDAGRDTLDRLFAHARRMHWCGRSSPPERMRCILRCPVCAKWEMLLLLHQESRMIRLKTR